MIKKCFVIKSEFFTAFRLVDVIKKNTYARKVSLCDPITYV